MHTDDDEINTAANEPVEAQPAPAGELAAPTVPAPPPKPTGLETIRVRLTTQEAVLFPVLVAFGEQLLASMGIQPANPRAAKADLQKRALSFQTGIPYPILAPERIAFERVDEAPKTPQERLVRVAMTPQAPSRLVDKTGRRLSS